MGKGDAQLKFSIIDEEDTFTEISFISVISFSSPACT